MTTIQGLFHQAQLAEAAYANFLSNSGVLLTSSADVRTALEASKFSPAQAATFANTWQLIDQYTAPSFSDLGLDGTGFSATIFKNIDSSSPNYGKYTLAIRGSTDLNDFIEDARIIAADGVAIRQLVNLYNFWQRVTTAKSPTGQGQSYRAAYVVLRDSNGNLPPDASAVQ